MSSDERKLTLTETCRQPMAGDISDFAPKPPYIVVVQAVQLGRMMKDQDSDPS